MILPQNPKVIVIDDKYNEVEPILTCFSKKGIPYLYFDGAPKNDPETAFSSVRLIVLDIDLETRGASRDTKSVASTITSFLKKIIADEYQPYYIIFWTKRNELIDKIITNMITIKKAPIGFTDWEKSEITSENTKTYIENKLSNTKIYKNYEFFIEWENLISSASSDFSNKFANIQPTSSEQWNSMMNNIFGELACSYTGCTSVDITDTCNTKYVASELNEGFINYLNDYKINTQLELPQIPQININNASLINTTLFLKQPINSNIIENGCIFYQNDDEMLNSLTKDILCRKFDSLNPTLVGIILTPPCDVAHKKNFTLNTSKTHRVIFGLELEIVDNMESYFMFNSKYQKFLSCLSKIEKKNNDFYKDFSIQKALNENDDFTSYEVINELHNEISNQVSELKKTYSFSTPDRYFKTAPFFIDGKNKFFIFHFGTVTTLSSSVIKTKYKLNSSLVADIQSKLAINVNRLGNNLIGNGR